ncbi:sulfatase-like hydrolase/transferase [Acidisoma cellulosilytica]|uniref:Sulfatase-like hydrolase/transferase n=1 Tax=Acidisoma cellulosilyticum TaxID=2802395 RepID=A0A963Z0U9_9PROT|nr:sulfatase-like hydrolase/transferase [Acidisoma cellulosilyticum]MCB8879942.1 sulfatase-like hydrolase/transferase [Acidisoma cellulosilyticum]
MADQPKDDAPNPSRRRLIASGAAMLGAGSLLPPLIGTAQAGETQSLAPPVVPPDRPPGGYNILFILVDQEHFFPQWPMPVPAREWLKAKGISFLNHQAASCVCSPARSTIYTGQHIQHTGVFDNAGSLWQPDMATDVQTIGHRMASLGYHAAYQGKWHLSANLDQTREAIDAPLADYRKIIESYGFDDFFGVGDIIDTTLGGYNYDDTTTAFTTRWFRTIGEDLRAAGKPWFLAVNFVNPHDVMYVNSDLPGETVQGKSHAMPIARPPADKIYQADWDLPLPATRGQSFDEPGRPHGQKIYQGVQDVLVGPWPDEDRRWRVLRNYYLNCIRDCDRQVARVLGSLKDNGLDQNTIIVFTADHGELGGNHQMRGKGNCAYWQQNHLPLMIVHPAYPGGVSCKAVTSQIDLVPTLLALTGADADKLKMVSTDLKGRDFSDLLTAPEKAAPQSLRPAALFNYNMLSFQDAKWAKRMDDFMESTAPIADKIASLLKTEPDFYDRCGIRSVFDGRYRFSRYFAPLDFNTPATYEDLTRNNDLELYDLQNDPEEINNLAAMPAHKDLVLAMNTVLNTRIAEEVGMDDGAFLPLRNGKWYFPPKSER